MNSEPDTTVYVIVAGKLRPPPRPVELRLFPVAGESISAVLQAQAEGDLLKTYLLARLAEPVRADRCPG